MTLILQGKKYYISYCDISVKTPKYLGETYFEEYLAKNFHDCCKHAMKECVTSELEIIDIQFVGDCYESN